METLLICLLLLYNAYLVFYLLHEKKQESKQQGDEAEPSIRQAEEVEDIVGKSRFKMEKKTSQATYQMPQAASSTENEYVTDVDVTFADEIEEAVPARLPDDKLDEAFTHVQISDMPLEYEGNEAEDDAMYTSYATGASFEEIGEAVKIAESSTATEEESRQAGRVFSEMEGNELFHQLTKTSSQRTKKITELMDYFLSNSISRDGDVAGEVVQLQNSSEVPASSSGFDIRDFV
jgi:hypothetical protein